MSGSIESVEKNGLRQDTFNYDEWSIIAEQSHILHSKCSAPVICSKKAEGDVSGRCLFCQFTRQLELPSFPDMTFARNRLQVIHKKGFGIEFNCLDALKTINAFDQADCLKVSAAGPWQEARSECSFAKKIVKNYDWTYRPVYEGKLIPSHSGDPIIIEETTQEIDMERLKAKDEIKYFESIDLFEDELADHGISQFNVRIRVMRDSFFILLRYFLRVDNILTRIIDTRFFHQLNQQFMLRERTERESSLTGEPFAVEIIRDPVKLANVLPLVRKVTHKLTFPAT